MRNTTPYQTRVRRQRSKEEVERWREQRESWMQGLDPSAWFHEMFDHLPGLHFFAKDKEGHLMFASRGLLDRYQMRDDTEILGRTDFDLNPDIMARAYVDDDKIILSGERQRIERMELWWDRQGLPDWFLITKLPILSRQGKVQGVMGVLRSPDESDRKLPVYQSVAKAVEIIRRDFSRPVSITDIARAAGQSLRQLQRQFKATFAISPQEFLIVTRIVTAQRLLEESSLSASEIALQCGFVDASSFTQHFRKRIGKTPATYRREGAGDAAW
ncbi:MAG: helix-turn-helix domain-containing protein [Verrucomicrobiota bacterium]